MKGLLYGIVFFCSLGIFAQEKEQDAYKQVTSQFMEAFNTQNYKGIFGLFNEKMQAAVPLEKTEAFISSSYSAMGVIEELRFQKVKGESHIYRTVFDKGVRNMIITLDSQNKIAGLLLQPHKPDDLPELKRNSTKMILPFNGEWFVFWGGTDVAKNYHVAYENQKYAYDIVKVKNGSSYEGDPKNNENYYAFGEDIIAPCKAEVVQVITGVHDNIPGEFNPEQLTGNTVVLKTEKEEFILFAHLKQGSVAVKEGQKVAQGERLGQCGNSGNTSEPHLHLSLQNVADMAIASGGKMYFDTISVNGEEKRDYIPIKEDFIKNIVK